MKNEDNRKIKSTGIILPVGSSSLIMVFIVLCTTIFTAITFMTATNEKKLTAQSTEFLKKYYLANENASHVLSNIQMILDNNSIEDDKYKSICAIDSCNVNIYKDNDKKIHIDFQMSIDDDLVIDVKSIVDDNKKINLTSYSLFNISSQEILDDDFLNFYEGD